MYKRIVVTTDFSDEAEAAIEVALKLAEPWQAEVAIVHVNERVELRPGSVITETHLRDAQQLARQSAEAELRRIDERFLDQKKVFTVLVEGKSAVDGICDYAREKGAELIVIATHGRTGVQRLLIGSVAERVVRHAPCHVLTVRATA